MTFKFLLKINNYLTNNCAKFHSFKIIQSVGNEFFVTKILTARIEQKKRRIVDDFVGFSRWPVMNNRT